MEAFAGFKLTKWNTFDVNDQFETSIPHIWAARDAVTGPKAIIEGAADAIKAVKTLDGMMYNLTR